MRWFALALGFIILFLIASGTFVVQETEQVIITQFGKPVGKPITSAGLHLKAPFIQDVHSFDKRVLEWDGPTAEMPTRDKLYIVVDAFARWQILDPMAFFLRFREERSAQSRLDDILGSEMRNSIARHDLVELVRTDKDRKPAREAAPGAASDLKVEVSASGHATMPGTTLPQIRLGRIHLEEEIFKAAADKLKELGIGLLDFRFKRINYNPAVANKIFERMTSERQQIAERFRSEGAGEAAKIIGQRGRDLHEIDSEAYRKVQAVEGKADAEASAIYAGAFNQSPEARDFYGFLRAMDTYRTSFQGGTTAILTTDSPFLKYLKGEAAAPVPGPLPGAVPAPTAPAPVPLPPAPAPGP